MRAIHLDFGVPLAVEPARGTWRNQPVLARPQGKVWNRRLGRGSGQGRIVDLMAGNALIKRPDVVLLGVAREGRAQGNDRADPVGNGTRKLAREQAAKAPSHDQHRLVRSDLVEPLLQPLNSV